MLDKTSKEYKTVKKLYSQGKISEEDYIRLLAALENRECAVESTEAEAENTVWRMIKEFGIKVTSSIKKGWDAANNAVDNFGDTLRGAVRRVACGVSQSLEDEEYRDPCRTPEQFVIPYDKLYIRLNYIGKKHIEVTTKTKKKAALLKKLEKIMGFEMYEKLNGLLAESFVGKYECSIGDEYMRLIVRPKNEL